MIYLITFLSLPLGVAWRGYVLSILWGWFIVPTFSLPPLLIVQAIGLSCVITAFGSPFMKKTKSSNDPKTEMIQLMANLAVGPAFMLLVSWPVTWFMP